MATFDQKVSNLEKMMEQFSMASAPVQRNLQSIFEFVDGTDPRFSTGDTAWMLFSCALVLLMTMPGLALYYSGMVRSKNVLACVMQVFTICCLITFLWLCFGYTLSFAPTIPNGSTMEVFGNFDRPWLRGMKLKTFHFLAPSIPESVYCMYQLTFAIITAALVCGSFADRMKYVPMCIFFAFWHLAVYCPMAHSNWHMQGFLAMSGCMDYAGGNVVHITSGISGLAVVLVIGNRKGFGKQTFESSNLVMTFTGMAMLWVGWMGFNGGSAVAASYNAGYACLATQISTGVASLTWLAAQWAMTGKPSVLGMISGAISGLVAITPGSGFVDFTGAFFIGFFAGPICYAGAKLKHYLGFDDALDAFGVHAIGGIWGGLAVGFFATDLVNETVFASTSAIVPEAINGLARKGVFYAGIKQGGAQLAIQSCGIFFAIGWSFVGTYIIAKLIDLTIGLRVSEDAEDGGLDESLHGEHAIAKGDA